MSRSRLSKNLSAMPKGLQKYEYERNKTMGAVANIKTISFDKLSSELKERGLNFRNASIQMGKSETYLGGMKRKGHLTESTLIMLDALWNIKYADIAPAVVAKESKSADESKPMNGDSLILTKEELRYIITEAVKDAFTWYANA